jgi:hypothetical protein
LCPRAPVAWFLKEGPEWRNTGGPPDDRCIHVVGQAEVMCPLHIGLDGLARFDAFAEEGRRNTVADAIADAIANHVDGKI